MDFQNQDDLIPATTAPTTCTVFDPDQISQQLTVESLIISPCEQTSKFQQVTQSHAESFNSQLSSTPTPNCPRDLFTTLPNELLVQILDHLNTVDSVCLALCCSNFYSFHKERYGPQSLKIHIYGPPYRAPDFTVTLGFRLVHSGVCRHSCALKASQCSWDRLPEFSASHVPGWAGPGLTYHGSDGFTSLLRYWPSGGSRFNKIEDIEVIRALERHEWERKKHNYFDLFDKRIAPRVPKFLELIDGGFDIQNGPTPTHISSVYATFNVRNGRSTAPSKPYKGVINTTEASFVAEIVAGIYEKQPSVIDRWGSLTITTFYRAQVFEIKKALKAKNPVFSRLRIMVLEEVIRSKPTPDILITSAAKTRGKYGYMSDTKEWPAKYVTGQARFMRIVVCDERFWRKISMAPRNYHCTPSWAYFLKAERDHGRMVDIDVVTSTA